MKVEIVVNPGDAVSYHRLVLPADTLPIEDIIISFNDPRFLGKLGESDVVIFSRELAIDIDEVKKKGAKVVMDIDDYWHLPDNHYLHKQWYREKMDLITQEHLQKADMVWCTNQQLKEVILPYNQNVHVIPNALPFGYDQFRPIKKKKVKHPIKFLYAGGVTHVPDVALLDEPFKIIGATPALNKHGVFKLAGYSPGLNWERMAHTFSLTNSYELIPAEPVINYMSVYKDADVALIPLQESNFSKHKSFLKILEAASHKLPVIVSNVLPYNELQNEGIFFVNTPEDWIKHIRYFIENPNHISYYGQLLHDYCKERYDLKKWSEVRHQLLMTL